MEISLSLEIMNYLDKVLGIWFATVLLRIFLKMDFGKKDLE